MATRFQQLAKGVGAAIGAAAGRSDRVQAPAGSVVLDDEDLDCQSVGPVVSGAGVSVPVPAAGEPVARPGARLRFFLETLPPRVHFVSCLVLACAYVLIALLARYHDASIYTGWTDAWYFTVLLIAHVVLFGFYFVVQSLHIARLFCARCCSSLGLRETGARGAMTHAMVVSARHTFGATLGLVTMGYVWLNYARIESEVALGLMIVLQLFSWVVTSRDLQRVTMLARMQEAHA